MNQSQDLKSKVVLLHYQFIHNSKIYEIPILYFMIFLDSNRLAVHIIPLRL
ncbi:hypothetical protein VPJ63_12765 [Mammaliicoccus lentus]